MQPSRFLLALLVTSLWTRQGRCAELRLTGTEWTVSTADGLQRAVARLQDSQTVLLNATTIRLKTTLVLDKPNIEIRGAEERTTLRCPANASAIAVNAANVTLEGLILRGCSGSSAVVLRRAERPMQNDLTLERVAFFGNRNGDVGGGLRVDGCCGEGLIRVRLRHCAFRRNDADSGAAIGGSHFALDIRHTRFAENVASRGHGGAINANESDLALVSSRFVKNEAAASGGAIYLTGSEAKLNATSTIFKRNECGKVTVGIHFSSDVIDAGGAIALHTTRSFALRECTFRKNSAVRGGALSVSQDSAVTRPQSWRTRVIDGCTFLGNDARETEPQKGVGNGGAIVVDAPSSRILLSISKTVFRANKAVRGGAVAASSSTPSTIQISDDNNDFQSNSAVSGGAVFLSGDVVISSSSSTFKENRADNGGAISLVQRSIFRVIPGESRVVIANNTAVRGGGVMCRRCGHLLFRAGVRFLENVAREYGGALFGFEFQGILTLPGPYFDGNVAAFGGAVALWDHGDAFIGPDDDEIIFTRNVALTGGALFIKAENAVSVTSRIENMLFERNEAINFSTREEASDSAALKRWREEWKKALNSTDHQRPHCRECLDGRGGALFIGLKDLRSDASVYQYLKRITIRNNHALVGGGAYIAMDRKNWDLDIGYQRCRDVSRAARPRPCYGLGHHEVIVENNTAELAGGGLFLQSVKDISSVFTLCWSETIESGSVSLTNRQTSLTRLLQNGDVEGYGPQVATNVVSLQLMNVNGVLGGFKSGQRICVKATGNETNALRRCTGILISVKDSLNQTITAGSNDTKLSVRLTSSSISGKSKYKARDGVITINETTVTGVNITDELRVVARGGSGISVSVQFSMLPCTNGELVDSSESRCFRCDPLSYSFELDEEACRPCEPHAVCAGTTALVPEDGYWHSTPFSPFMRRCLSRKACKEDDRRSRLIAYYNDSVAIVRELRAFNRTAVSLEAYAEIYPQCSAGYTGMICGTCLSGYGHSSGGECVQCTQSVAMTRFLTILSACLLFLVVTVKVLLEIDGVRKDVLFELAEQKRAVSFVIQQAEEQRTTGNSSGTPAKISGPSNDRPSPVAVATQPRRPPALVRSPPVSDPLSAQARSSVSQAPSPDAMDASGVLSETYKILFNYIQLNSVALSLDIDWKETLNNLLAVQSSVGRVTSFQFLPFDCNMRSRDDDSSSSRSLAVLWYRACFPLMTAVVHVVIIKTYQFARPERRRTRFEIDTLPPMRLIFLVVYLSYCIDISTDLLKVLNCIHVVPVDFEHGHDFAQYEILQSEYVWAEDTDLECWKGAHLVATVFAVIGLSISLGMIAFTITILYTGKRDGRLRRPRFLLRYGFLYLGYRKQGLALYWESVITVRRMLLAAIGVYAHHRETSNAQIGLLAIIIFTSIALQEIIQPYEDTNYKASFPSYAGCTLRYFGLTNLADQWLAFNQYVSLNALEGASLFMSLSLFLVGMSINDRKATDFEVHLLLVTCTCLNSLFVAFLLYRLWCGLHHSLDVSAQEMSISFGDGGDRASKTWLIAKAWLVLKATIADKSEAEVADTSV